MLIDLEGKHLVGPGGKHRYAVVIEWSKPESADLLSAAALDTLRRGGVVLDGGG
jgi:hypothetical protein